MGHHWARADTRQLVRPQLDFPFPLVHQILSHTNLLLIHRNRNRLKGYRDFRFPIDHLKKVLQYDQGAAARCYGSDGTTERDTGEKVFICAHILASLKRI